MLMSLETNNRMVDKNDLIGIWQADSDMEYGNASMQFSADGSLTYTVLENGKKQIINLIYWLEGDYLCTDQTSSPKVEKTRVRIENGKLLLDYSGTVTSF